MSRRPRKPRAMQEDAARKGSAVMHHAPAEPHPGVDPAHTHAMAEGVRLQKEAHGKAQPRAQVAAPPPAEADEHAAFEERAAQRHREQLAASAATHEPAPQ